MKKKAIIAISIFIAAIAGLLIVIASQPDEFKVTRTATITAPAEIIFAHVNDLHKWQAWSPWAKLDPNSTTTYEGAESGVGAAMSWAGNSEVGVGTMKITENKPSEFIKFQLDFEKPMKSTHNAEFNFTAQQNNETYVTWSMHGKSNFLCKAMGLFFNCQKMVGDQFDQGLTSLKAIAEKEAAEKAAAQIAPATEELLPYVR